MALEIVGKLVAILPEVGGVSQRGEWKKQEFVIETTEQYPKKVCISAWGDKVADIQAKPLESLIKVYFNLESREYNGRWFSDIRAWKIETVSNENPSTPGDVQTYPTEAVPNFSLDNSVEDDLPF